MFSSSSVMFTERRARKTSLRRSMSCACSGGVPRWMAAWANSCGVTSWKPTGRPVTPALVATCSRGQGLRAGEEIPLADVTVVGEGGHGDARDVLRVHHGKHAVAGRVHDL